MKKRLLISLLTLLCCSTGAWAEGELNGVFSVSSTKKVQFSQGNLQYVGTWQFAENQWDCFSTSQYNDHRDLFGWGTGDAPNKVSNNNGDYGTFTDWGTNAITNGGNTENSGWRTLTKDEWVYLFYSRENAATLFGFGSVNSKNGLIILPDNWTTPEGASFTASTTLGLTNQGSYYHNGKEDNYSHNTYTAEQWAVMESAGAVFLPAAAYRHGADSNMYYTDLGGFYWSSTPYDSDKAYYLNFYYNDLAPQFNEMRYGGRPVRLVKDVPASSIPGALSGRFTINASGEKVLFSQGNLQYQASTDTWRFAENQYDYIGSANSSISESYTGWIDLFGWATNGLEANTATGKMPYYTGTTDEDYGPSITSGEFDKTIYDWGKAIDDSWHTLSNAEWNYIFAGRASYSSLYGFGRLFGVNGVFLLPDDWSWSETSIATAATAAGFTWSGGAKTFSSNIISNNTLWSVMESAGAVFIPAAGYRQGTTINMSGNGGDYWSSTASSDTKAYRTSFYNEHLNLSNNYGRSDGISVRLVRSPLQQDAEGNYLLSSADDWKDFAAIVNSGTNPAANAKMTADIDLGDDQTMISDNVSYRYSGVFDGQGHKLNVNYYSSETTVAGGYYIAPFRDIQGATIKNLTVTGNITGYMHCAGVAGVAFGPSTNLISNVTVSANITILNTHGGGFIGHNENATTTIQDCLFNGTINGKSGGSTVGVFFGWSESSATMSLINCLENGSYTNCSTFTPTSCPGYAVPTVTNCYYAVSGSYQGTQATAAQLSDGTTSTALQNGRAEEIWVQDPMTNQPMLKLFATKAYTVPASGIGTFSAKAKFAVPDGLTAHYCKTYDKKNGTIGVVDIDGAVPANTGVLLKGTPGETYTLTGTNNEAATVTGNALVAVTEATHVEPIDGDYTNFMLKSGTFIMIADSGDDVKMPANKAYLQILTSQIDPEPASARAIRLSWGGVTSIHNSQLIIHNYALPAKRIVKGKLIIEKNGQMFNANGQLIK